MEGQQKYYVDENGQWEFPLGLRQLAMVQMDLNGRNKYGQDSGVGNVGNGLRMRFPIDRQRLEQSIQRVVDENDALRLILVQKGDTLWFKASRGIKLEEVLSRLYERF